LEYYYYFLIGLFRQKYDVQRALATRMDYMCSLPEILLGDQNYFELLGVIHHRGGTVTSGHYFAQCKSDNQ